MFCLQLCFCWPTNNCLAPQQLALSPVAIVSQVQLALYKRTVATYLFFLPFLFFSLPIPTPSLHVPTCSQLASLSLSLSISVPTFSALVALPASTPSPGPHPLPLPTVNLFYTRSVAWYGFSGGHPGMGLPGTLTPAGTTTIIFHNSFNSLCKHEDLSPDPRCSGVI